MGALLCISQAILPEIFLSSHGPLLAARHAERATRTACMATLRVAWHAPAWAGAVAGFLRYNFNPASIFLGDCGSLLISIAGELLFLRLVGLALSCADDLQHNGGFSDCAEDFCE